MVASKARGKTSAARLAVRHERNAAKHAAPATCLKALAEGRQAGSSCRRRCQGAARANGARRKPPGRGDGDQAIDSTKGLQCIRAEASNCRRSTDSATTGSFRIRRVRCRSALGRIPCMPRNGRARARHGGHHDRHVNFGVRAGPFSGERASHAIAHAVASSGTVSRAADCTAHRSRRTLPRPVAPPRGLSAPTTRQIIVQDERLRRTPSETARSATRRRRWRGRFEARRRVAARVSCPGAGDDGRS